MSKHTPGPWLTNGYRSPIDGAICVFHRPFGLGDIASVWSNEFDARLIAAAPELLEALQECLNTLKAFPLNQYDMSSEAFAAQRARAAIAKATGEPS